MELGGIRVLVVDDTPDSLDMLVELLGALGAEVRGAPSALAGLQECVAFAPHVILTDLEMPEKSGYGFMRDLRSGGFTVPVIAITGYVTGHHEERARAAGFAAFLPKPSALTLIRDTILRALSTHPS